MNRLFVLSFENDAHWRSYKQYFLPTVEIKDYSIMIDGKNLFDQPIKNNLKTYENIRKITTGQGDDYTTGCLLDYNYFTNYRFKQTTSTWCWSKSNAPINFTLNLDPLGQTAMYLLKKQKKPF